MAAGPKGTVTSFASMFSAEEALKASERVKESIAEKLKDLDTLDNFVADNTNLINLVQRLPDELHHHIMVPFGKAAFFPGRLVHTNEFTVLLGEGYYAERTAKQTVDILKRRGKTLESQVESLKGVIKDIKTEASFFDRTAAEVAEGFVEIREEYTDEDSVAKSSISGPQRLDVPSPSKEDNVTGGVDDEDYARIMARFDELEREELEAEDSEEANDENGETEEGEGDENGIIEEVEDENEDSEELKNDENGDTETHKDDKHDERSYNLLRNWSSQSRIRDDSSHGKALMQVEASKLFDEDYERPSILKSSHQSSANICKKVSFQIPEQDGCNRIVRQVTESLKAFPGTITERMDNLALNSEKQTSSQAYVRMPKSDAGSQLSSPNTDSLKAFSNTIVERVGNLALNPEKQTDSQVSNSQSSRPVSRFKMQRRAYGLN